MPGPVADADTEAKHLASQFIAEGYRHDDVAEATAKGGLTAGYAAYLDKYKDTRLTARKKDGVSVRRSDWAKAPDSEEYKRRQASFGESYLAHLRRAHQSPCNVSTQAQQLVK
ncbi:hypothetical protein KFL_006210050 [Klebsormidium nitens]|uniref:Uncharacterized protein n=1 Tax=Klebsormidium nitens TaxID=105231 RepID=A0A1Y1IMA2_KLENI|nr:hypothetical protein KFL_006210050 [Klebsormidium nitens]|eukprot:GAQ90281.1 hypothetical protein KFL_006210050 [Klebsormidium nitens]